MLSIYLLQWYSCFLHGLSNVLRCCRKRRRLRRCIPSDPVGMQPPQHVVKPRPQHARPGFESQLESEGGSLPHPLTRFGRREKRLIPSVTGKEREELTLTALVHSKLLTFRPPYCFRLQVSLNELTINPLYFQN